MPDTYEANQLRYAVAEVLNQPTKAFGSEFSLLRKTENDDGC